MVGRQTIKRLAKVVTVILLNDISTISLVCDKVLIGFLYIHYSSFLNDCKQREYIVHSGIYYYPKRYIPALFVIEHQ